ncbi:E3 ubiquitin-protein ligase ubr11 [Cyphellophora attinorum]|uniref:E3 ubiquitin-protein ligase n=1 Tax=Cyphellophora attinorum TaxID=1664694 RepID=A0A0N1H8X8_9EURO|nr:E3 ubiquitin-protein ligase ubr11 [Phialophora attinorum]KPI39910.1 E3 ubiquitin-protein ligase ubr11 [Phialophora attinorum]
MNPPDSRLDRILLQTLCHFPRKFECRYSDEARDDLLQTLFRALTNDRADYLEQLFPRGFPASYRLQDAQGAEAEPEYSAAARGSLCGHIFKPNEVYYHCATCTNDPTAVLCARCFASSEHEGHQLIINISSGNSGCCDCGDVEAWNRPVHCAIHTASDDNEQADEHMSTLPDDLQQSIRTTIGRVLDYFCDVISCSPEHLRLPKSIDSIKEDEVRSRLDSKHYSGVDDEEDEPEFCLIIWNDEKHTIKEVQDQVARACKEKTKFGLARAMETNDVGRSVVRHSRDLQMLTKMAKVIEQIKVTVTIRSSRDTFREQMCGTIIEWLSDIAGASIGDDARILRRIVCEELLQVWRVGSRAWNAKTGEDSLDSHGIQSARDDFLSEKRLWTRYSSDPIQLILQPTLVQDDTDDTMEEDADETGEGDADLRDEDVIDASALNTILNTTTFQALAQPLVDHLVDAEATDDADEMDTDGDGEFVDLQRIEIEQASPPTNTGTAMDNTATPVPGGRTTSRSRPSEQNVNFMTVPKVHKKPAGADNGPHGFWLMDNTDKQPTGRLPPYEDLTKSIRLDYMIIFDLRLWKIARVSLRDLYISTVVNIPKFKRVLGLRFSGLYTTLAQLYLIADREPDHSIMNLSNQILTTPSICQERIEKGNFLTNIMAILYTFLTNRQVGFAEDIDSHAVLSFDPGAVANRRLFHFFNDLKHFLSSEYVQVEVRSDTRYLSQYLDLMKLLQGICPNIRAVGDHVEYETDTWISASMLTKESNKLCRTFAETFKVQPGTGNDAVFAAIFAAAGVAMINSLGLERKRFEQNEIKQLVQFHQTTHRVVDFAVAQGALSFHHPLHYTLSWLLEIAKDSARCVQELKASAENVVVSIRKAPLRGKDEEIKSIISTGEDALLAMFDYPLRVCAWLAQMKANMWVRNGMSLRHQMGQYKSVSYRDVAHQRDLFLLQTALVTCDPSRLLASMVDRFGLTSWMSNGFSPLPDCDDTQMVELAEDFIYLLINLLSDRDGLTTSPTDPDSSLTVIRKEIAHCLCFKALSYSELWNRLTERVQEHPRFQEILETMTRYRPPEGLHDTGLFELKEEYLQELDPYNSHFSKNQRDEAESIYKKWLGKKSNKDPEDVVLEPKLHPITSEAYKSLAAVSQCELFTSAIYQCLSFVATGYQGRTGVTATRAESFLQIVLQLALIATLEDHTAEQIQSPQAAGFIHIAGNVSLSTEREPPSTVVRLLHKIWLIDEYSACRSKIRHILRLFNQKKPNAFRAATQDLEFPMGRFDTASPANLESEIEAKKRQAAERKARVMAQFQQQQQSFMDNQDGFDWEDEQLDDPDLELPTSTESHGHILRQTDVVDSAFVREVLHTPKDLDRTLDRQRPFGVAGDNDNVVSQMTSTGSETKVMRQSISSGWPAGCTAKGPLTSSCGHIMHFSCFEGYFQSVLRRHSQQVARQHPERVSAQEFVCPLCKALANAFLPIVWKSTEQSYPAALAVKQDFTDFVERDLATRSIAANFFNDTYNVRATNVHKSNLSTFANSALESAIERSQAAEIGSPSITAWAERPELAPLVELGSVYIRLKGPLSIIARVTQPGIFPAKFHNEEQPNSYHLLLNSLANTICATETAYRGREGEFGTTLLTGIPQQTLSHLQILSSTVRSYAATCHILEQGGIDEHFHQVYMSLFNKLFGKPPDPDNDSHEHIFLDSFALPLLRIDPFTFLVHSSLVLCPLLDIDPRHMLQIALIAEVLRVVVAYFYDPQGLITAADTFSLEVGQEEQTPSAIYEGVLKWLDSELRSSDYMQLQEQFNNFTMPTTGGALIVLSRIVDRYALAFLRKAAIFCHVALGVDFPTTTGSEASLPEMHRLLHFMQLPSLAEILMDLTEFAPRSQTKKMVSSWITDLVRCASSSLREDDHSPATGHLFDIRSTAPDERPTVMGIRLLHPAPLELIGLPKYYDVLIELSSRATCPTTGKELSDPALCLFCGALFCSQSVCCQTSDKRGGCNAHVEKCSAPIGMFLLIRKCMIALLHVMKDPNQPTGSRTLVLGGGTQIFRTGDAPPLGSFFPAPYLTKHGETDSGLRNKHQLMLSQMRYDRLLRDSWLMVNGSIWSAIARKLEGEVNSGGWETL